MLIAVEMVGVFQCTQLSDVTIYLFVALTTSFLRLILSVLYKINRWPQNNAIIDARGYTPAEGKILPTSGQKP
jgi:hypothetical protein